MKKYFITFIFFFFIFLQNVFALEFDITAKNVALYNLDDNKVIYSKNADEKVMIASLTKIMTVLVAIENVDLNKEVIVKSRDFNEIYGYSKAGLKVGDKLTYKELLYAIMLPSGADAVNCLVNNTFGLDEFINKMNTKAKEIGLYNTLFNNAIGKDNNLNYSTANDIVKLLNYALLDNDFKEIFQAKTYKTTNNLLFKSTITYYDDILNTKNILGSKTGYTRQAGRCLASISKLNNVNYMLVVLNSDNENNYSAIKDSLIIYDYYSSNYGYKNVLNKNTIVDTIPIKYSSQKYYKVKANEDINLYLKNDSNIKYEYDGIKEIKYNTTKGTYLGDIKIYNNDEFLLKSKVYLNDNIKYYSALPIIIFLILFIILNFIIILIKKRK